MTADDPTAHLADDARCPCLSGETYGACCGRLHRGEAAAATAEALMRSRFSAFAVGDAGYLLRTWHPSTRPAALELDDTLRWYRLDILATARGGLLDTEGMVEFVAHHKIPGVRGSAGSQHERSRFSKDTGAWTYVDGIDPGV
ncbi:YchJ family protein [Plantibacter sp. Leaf314]|uniref:YchJ family protein n=1 Tax=Plantibacter sp. Leaf314 TaxID=1736333 RepID=UPI0006FEE9A1|nr:YchJ family metal-binding protein [Plantibacter sp. Leaf314]KQQ49682.1 zinc-binding protein [Plantibacter sp. Leaf314]